jgi:hypothetical protein
MNQVFRSGLLAVLFNLQFSLGVFGAGTVTNTNDSGPGSLRTVLLGGGGTITIAVDGTISLASPLDVLSSVTIDASGHNVTISGGNAVRVFTINAPITVSMINLTIANGAVTGANGGAGVDGGSAQGAGILMAGSTLNISNCQFVANTVTAGNGGASPAGTGGNGGKASGGAIDLLNGVLNATNCQFYGNTASGGSGGFGNIFGMAGDALGGAIHSSSGPVMLVNCLFQTNQIHGGLSANGLATNGNYYAYFSGAALGGAVSVQSGSSTNLNCQFLGNSGSIFILPVQNYKQGEGGPAQGGAIYSSGGPLLVSGGTFTSNNLVGGEAQNTVGAGGSGQGGAVFSQGLTVLNACLFGQNSVLGGSNGSTAGDGQGGAVYVNGAATISQSWFTSNTVQGGSAYVANLTRGFAGAGNGGALYSTNSPSATNSLTIIASTFSDNQALGVDALNTGGAATAPASPASGGAVFTSTSCLLTNDTLTGNFAMGGSTASTNNAVVATGGSAFGGALCSSTGTVVCVNSTLALNNVQGGTGPTNNGASLGGGIFSTNGSVTLINTILTNGAAGTNFSGVLVDGGHNLSSDGSCNFTNTGSLNNTDPLLGPLQDNGGPTPTMALLAGSPAIDAADATNSPILDQRGIVRPVGPAPDMGAFEYYDTNSPPACSDFLSATNATLTASAGSGAVILIANYYCNWSASSDSAWLTITSGTNGTGLQILKYSATANSASLPRVGILTIAGQTLTVTQLGTDLTSPTVTITAPAANAQLTNLTVTVTGTAKDSVGLAAVEYRLENANGIAAYQNATGTTNWTADIPGIAPGGNTVRVRALDLNSNLSAEVTRTFISVQKQALTVTTNGVGTVSPDLNGKILQLGNTYTVTAKPGAGNVLSNWTGSLTSTAVKLTFVMVSNMVLNATFATNMFVPVQGTYNGLITDQTNQLYTRSGYLSLKLASSGALSGQMIIGGVTYSIKSQVGAAGQVEIPLLGGSPKQQIMTAAMQFDLTGGSGQVNGTLSDARVVNGAQLPATWVSALSGDRTGFFTRTNPAPQAGPYTLLFTGGDGVTVPAGWGYATVKVDALGNVQMSGFLAEGTSIGQKTTVSRDGRWPLFAKLSSAGNVSVVGWMYFTNLPLIDIVGQAVWTKLPLSAAAYYPAGFVNPMPAVGSRYVAPTNSANGILPFTNGYFGFSGGFLAAPVNSTIRLTWDGKVTNTSTNMLSVSINKATGAFSGKVTVSGTTTVLPFKGAILQGQNVGEGYFIGGLQSGRALLTH